MAFLCYNGKERSDFMELVKSIEEADYITHSGTMHADEVFSTAFLDLYKKDIKVFRTTSINPDEYPNKTIYDIGRQKFDHHQEDARVRDNGIKYCSFGLLWEEYGKDYLKELNLENIDELYLEIVKDFVEQIDAIDNGEFPKVEARYRLKSISDVIKIFNPSFRSSENESTQFIKAVEIAKVIFAEEILNCNGKVIAKNLVLDKVKQTDKKYIILDEYMPYEETIINNEEANNIVFVIYPSSRGGYALKTIPKSNEEKSSRCEIPVEWAGKSDEELVNACGIKDVTFCHIGRFIISTKTKEAAIEIVEKMIEIDSNK